MRDHVLDELVELHPAVLVVVHLIEEPGEDARGEAHLVRGRGRGRGRGRVRGRVRGRGRVMMTVAIS